MPQKPAREKKSVAKQAPSVVEAIDRALTVLNHHAGGSELGSVTDIVSRGLAKKLLEARELGETLEGILKVDDASPP